MQNLDLDPHSPETQQHLWNCDETGFCTAASAKTLLVRRGTKQVSEVSNGSDHEYITVHTACCASGEWLPPFILYKGKNLYQRWMTGGLAGARYGISESGWMDTINFLSWFTRHFIPAVKHLTETGPVLLLFDGHYSHISLELIRQARQHNIHLTCLPPNTTHLLQPLDVGVFAVLKKYWRKILKQYRMETRGGKATKETFPGLIAQLWDTFTPGICKAGFRSTGLAPFSREHVLSKLPPIVDPLESESSLDRREDTNPFTCTSCGHKMPATPMVKTRLVSHFSSLLEVHTDRPRRGERNKARVRVEGEAITSDEFLEILEVRIKEKELKKCKNGQKKTLTTEGMHTHTYMY